MTSENAYGLWPLVVLSSVATVGFAASFFHPKTKRDWRAMGAFSAFAVALFTEMYGFPLTIYLLTGWLGDRVPWLNLTHDNGHLLNGLIGWKGDAHVSPLHLVSYALIGLGFWLVAAAWRRLWAAAQAGRLAIDGLYRHIRHPQYSGFLLIMVGFLFQWPTIPTLIMFPILVVVYRRLAIGEEREVAIRFPEDWSDYAAVTPRFLPSPRRRPRPSGTKLREVR
ncbi:MAG TPA: isoprenylcysteine carboxylmethyltransferase family protein [Thermoleophilia bacterium]|nr:isoprenylcysteine carboxylmethyltransferase family protein [Thermoleophilia bacterium]